MSRHPEVKWAQREDKIYITVLLADAKNPKVNLEPEGVFTFSATAGAENHLYEFKIELQDKVNVEESKINIGVRNIFCVLEKEEKKWWNKLLREGKPPHYVKVDWDKWVDEDEDNGPPSDLDLGGMDFSKFGDMGGMGGMGMPGMGGMGMGDDAMGNDFDDSDDEEQATKPEESAPETIIEKPKVEGEAAEGKAQAS
ncbi:PREDICTED: uncharacterized protein Os08g0359500-like isoform X3 [Ipomoea nil]|uniref:uncharacterized protein Os08g0359500-like isoform X3 n=1 Tax=Ipomoea nil TaxID=35883 RepID=UPI000901EF46|nr:PREDICTED: uncharacterized protein Os08g0359500-like isoform X3 [Ipomoea nil]